MSRAETNIRCNSVFMDEDEAMLRKRYTGQWVKLIAQLEKEQLGDTEKSEGNPGGGGI